jgi:hypothetical protein
MHVRNAHHCDARVLHPEIAVGHFPTLSTTLDRLRVTGAQDRYRLARSLAMPSRGSPVPEFVPPSSLKMSANPRPAHPPM